MKTEKREWNWLYDDSDNIYLCQKCKGEFYWRELTVGGLCEGCEYELE